eukprot:jgi/Mesvir1/27958/Mv20166-RA.1
MPIFWLSRVQPIAEGAGFPRPAEASAARRDRQQHAERVRWLAERVAEQRERVKKLQRLRSHTQHRLEAKAAALRAASDELRAHQAALEEQGDQLLACSARACQQLIARLVQKRVAVLQQLRSILPMQLFMDRDTSGRHHHHHHHQLHPQHQQQPHPHQQQHALASGAAETVTVQLCGARLPPDAEKFLSLPPWELAAAFGWLFHLLELMSHYLDLPLLHAGQFKGSYTCIWQPSTFYDPWPHSGDAAINLFVEAPSGSGGGSSGTTPTAAAASRPPTSSASGSAWASLATCGAGCLGPGDGLACTGVGGAGSCVVLRLQRGAQMLQRSAACLAVAGFRRLEAAEEAGGELDGATGGAWARLQASLPQRQPMVLVALLLQQPAYGDGCGVVRSADAPPGTNAGDDFLKAVNAALAAGTLSGSIYPGQDSVYISAAHALGATPRPLPDASTPSPATELSRAMAMREPQDPGYDSDDADANGWSLIEAPPPPPPSQPEDVDHWIRAMFVDAH